MAMFDRAIGLLFTLEGGYGEQAADPGGATNYGVSLRTALAMGDGDRDGRLDFDLDADGDVDAEDIRQLTPERARAFYRTAFWAPLRCEALPPPVGLAVFDSGVNCGTKQAARFLQRALRVEADGWIGPVTLAAAQRADLDWVVEELLVNRMALYASLSTWGQFGRGWTRRVLRVHREALALL